MLGSGLGWKRGMQIALLAALAVAPIAAQADALPSEQAVEEYTVRLMQGLGRGELDAVHKAIKAYTVLPTAEVDAALETTKKQRDEKFMRRFGRSYGFALVRKEQAGGSMIRYTYIEKAELQPIPWTFSFYRTKGGWVLNEFGWNGSPSTVFSAQ